MPKKRKRNEQTLKEAIKLYFDTYQLNGQVRDAKVVSMWEGMMGKTIAKHTKGIYVNQGTLYLKIDSAPLKQEMFFAKNRIKQIINNKLGENYIKEVVFR